MCLHIEEKTSAGFVFTNKSLEHSLSFSPRYLNMKVTQIPKARPHGLANQKLCYIQMLLNLQKKLENKNKKIFENGWLPWTQEVKY